MKWLAPALLGCAIATSSGCKPSVESAQSHLVMPSLRGTAEAISPEVRALAEKALGAGAEVLATGDLAQNGRQEVLAANRVNGIRLDKGGPGLAQGVRVTRAVVLEKEGAIWHEVLRCDEYLKNPRGFLEGAPRGPVTGWLLRVNTRDGRAARDWYFTPLESGQARNEAMVRVRWNPLAGRYQSRTEAGQFLREIVMLDIPGSELR